MEPDRSAERLLVAEAVASNQIEVLRKRRPRRDRSLACWWARDEAAEVVDAG
jgi:hypothetical protein